MKAKKKTTATKTTKRTTQWNEYFKAAITGLSMASTGNPDATYSPMDEDIVHSAAFIVKSAEKIADIAIARNA